MTSNTPNSSSSISGLLIGAGIAAGFGLAMAVTGNSFSNRVRDLKALEKGIESSPKASIQEIEDDLKSRKASGDSDPKNFKLNAKISHDQDITFSARNPVSNNQVGEGVIYGYKTTAKVLNKSQVESKDGDHYQLKLAPFILEDEQSIKKLVVEDWPEPDVCPPEVRKVTSTLAHATSPVLNLDEEARIVSMQKKLNVSIREKKVSKSFLRKREDAKNVLNEMVEEYLLPLGTPIFAYGSVRLDSDGRLLMTKSVVLTNKSEMEVLSQLRSSLTSLKLGSYFSYGVACLAGIGTVALAVMALMKWRKNKKEMEQIEDQ